MPPSDKTAIQCVIEVDQERIRLEKEAEYFATKDDVGKFDIDLTLIKVCLAPKTFPSS